MDTLVPAERAPDVPFVNSVCRSRGAKFSRAFKEIDADSDRSARLGRLFSHDLVALGIEAPSQTKGARRTAQRMQMRSAGGRMLRSRRQGADRSQSSPLLYRLTRFKLIFACVEFYSLTCE